METTNGVKIFRWVVFVLAAFYFCYAFSTMVPSEFGWQYRFLTNWALAMSLLSAFYMLQRSLGRRDTRHDVWASTTVVVNFMVVLLYWKIYFADPTQFYVDGIRTIPLWQEYYLHLLGPVLQWIDAFFLLGVFKNIKRTFMLTLSVIVLYLVWIEIVVEPMNATPVGTVTTGLPYRFLNNLELDGRMMFYFQNVVVAIVMIFAFWGLAAMLRKFKLSPA